MELLFWCVVPERFCSDRLTHGKKIAAPKVLHGLMAAGTDIWVQELSRKTLGQSHVPATVSVAPTYSLYLIRDVLQFFLSLTSFFHTLSLSRSMSNSLETTLTTIALCYYPWDSSILPSRYAGRTLLPASEDAVTHTDHNFVNFCCSLP